MHVNAVCCSVLQCVGVCCSVIHCVAVYSTAIHRVAMCCSCNTNIMLLQLSAACCSAFGCVAVCCSAAVYFIVLQCVATSSSKPVLIAPFCVWGSSWSQGIYYTSQTLERFSTFESNSFSEKNPCHHCSEF